jgi:hypothetical protein
MRALALTLLLACSACVAAPYPYYPAYYAPYPSVAAPPPQQQPDVAQQNCHEFETTVMIDGQQQQARGTTCLQPDGSWKVE